MGNIHWEIHPQGLDECHMLNMYDLMLPCILSKAYSVCFGNLECIIAFFLGEDDSYLSEKMFLLFTTIYQISVIIAKKVPS